MAPQSRMLPDGRRLHLNHGPIDLIIEANTAARDFAYAAAKARFETVLDELVAELTALRRPTDAHRFQGSIARRMQAATRPHLPEFITPMAAVAGAVADEILAAMCKAPGLIRAHVNNGGDVAFHLTDGAPMMAAMAGGRITLRADQPWRGVATSGWRGRSHSLGIADAVTVVARTAALADAAATMIANAVDLPGHTAIRRLPAQDLAPDSDLGARLVTVAVGALSRTEIALALNRGATLARTLSLRGVIGSACLALGGQTCVVDAAPTQIEPELSHA